MKQKAIIVDLDGALANCDHRLHHIQGDKKDWDKFFSELHKDKVNIWCLDLVFKYISEGQTQVLFVTGRKKSLHNLTVDWLNKKCSIYKDDALHFMRKDGDYRPDTEVKKEIYEKHIKDKYEVLFCIDDRKGVAQMWRSLGLVCLHCAEGDY